MSRPPRRPLAAAAISAVAALLAAAVACGGSSGGGSSGGPVQGTTADAGGAQAGTDAGTSAGSDAGAGELDAGAGDGGADAGASDGGASDGGVATADGGAADAGTPDAGSSASACDGILPPSPGAAVTAAIDSARSCDLATTHPSGRVALFASGPTIDVGEYAFPRDPSTGAEAGTSMGPLRSTGEGDFVPVANGFQGVSVSFGGGTTRLRTWDVDGNLVSDLDGTGLRTLAPLADGGTAGLFGPAPGSTGARIIWIDARGAVRGSTQLDRDAADLVASWDTGHLVVVTGAPPEARWLDAAGAPLTDWFALGPAVATAGHHLLPGGVVAFRGADGAWIAAARDGVAGPAPVPAWLAGRPGTRLATIRGGRALAVVPASGGTSIELVSGAGESCGAVALPPHGVTPAPVGSRLDVGWDGTVLQTLAGAPVPPNITLHLCSFRWWPGLLR